METRGKLYIIVTDARCRDRAFCSPTAVYVTGSYVTSNYRTFIIPQGGHAPRLKPP